MPLLESFIRSEIKKSGPMDFARFMGLCLYHPEWGYYAREGASRQIGARGDFITSVSIGAFFGRLLARQFALWWRQMGQPKPFYLAEAGAWDGRLARDILLALRQDDPVCWDAVHYALIEPLHRLAALQKETLRDFLGGVEGAAGETVSKLTWVRSVGELGSLDGVLFANELLDAFPVHLLERSHGVWKERCIGEERGQLAWVSQSCPRDLQPDLEYSDGGRMETCPLSLEWLKEAQAVLRKGRILLLDYGWTDDEYISVVRPHGTLRGYRRHSHASDVLLNPGEQDLTAHVRWTPLLKLAGSLGLDTEEFIQQSRWLTRILAQHPFPMSPKEIRQFHTLTHPEMMGEAFRVVVFRKDRDSI